MRVVKIAKSKSGLGCFILGLFALATDISKAFAKLHIFYEPTGPLSGGTCSPVFLWLLTWIVLARRWDGKSVAIVKINALAFGLLSFGFLLSCFPFSPLWIFYDELRPNFPSELTSNNSSIILEIWKCLKP